MKLRKCIAAAMAAVLMLTGCTESPESDIIVHKDMEKVIGEAQQTDESKADLQELRQETHYKAELENESLHVKIHADADITMPDTEKLSVIHVEKQQFSQEFTDKVRELLLSDRMLCDGKLLMMRTKEDLLEDIRFVRANIQNPPESATEANLASWQWEIDEKLQPEYNAAPEEIVFSEYPSDGQLHTIKELYEQEKAAAGGNVSPDAYYRRRYDVDADAEMLSCVTDGADGTFSTLYVYNSPNEGSTVSFARTSLAPTFGDTTGLDLMTGTYSVQFGLPENTLAYYSGDNRDYCALPGNTAALSQQEAQALADELLSALGLDAFSFYEGGLYTELVSFWHAFDSDVQYYRTAYILRYFRHIDSCPLLRGGSKNDATEQQHYRKAWQDEMIEIRVDDSGIIGFVYESPLKLLETTVSDAAMMPFSEIRDTFETMAPMMTAHEDYQFFGMDVKVTDIILSYIRISEKDSYDTGYLVPVWGFYGTRTPINELGEHMVWSADEGLLVSINAIDGSVIVPGAGY